MGQQRYILHCEMKVACKAIAREFDLGHYKHKFKVDAFREREDSGRTIWRLYYTDRNFLFGSLECVPGSNGTTILFVEDPPMTKWKLVRLKEVDLDLDRMIEVLAERSGDPRASDVAKQSIQIWLVEDLLDTLEADYNVSVVRPPAEKGLTDPEIKASVVRMQFVINTTPNAFYGWLRDYTQEQFDTSSLQFPHGHGLIHLQPATVDSNAIPHSSVVRLSIPHSSVVRLSLRRYHLIQEDNGKTVTALGEFTGNEYIGFKLVPLDNRRTEVTTQCKVPLSEPYFSQLLTTISRTYSESAAAIDRQLEEKQPEAAKGHIGEAFRQSDPPSTSEQSPKRTGGRPRDPDNEWAYEQINVLGRPLREVYIDWQERIGAKVKTLDDPYDSFKKAVRPKKGS